MRIISTICIAIFCSGMLVHGEERKEACVEFHAQVDESRAEISYEFPSSLKEGELKEYVEVIKKRLEFISGHQATADLNKKEVVFSFEKGDLNDVDIELLSAELLSNFKLSFYEVLTDREFDQMTDIVLKLVPVEKGKRLIVAIADKPFLTLFPKDISQLDFGTMKENGTPIFRMYITLKKKSDVLEEISCKPTKTFRQIYVDFNDGLWAEAPLVFQKISDRLSMGLDDAYLGKLLEMQYKYPLPESR